MTKEVKKRIKLNDDWRVFNDSHGWILEHRSVSKKEDVESWAFEGFYGRFSQMITALAERTVLDQYGKVTTISKSFKELKKLMEDLPELMIIDKMPSVMRETTIVERRTTFLKKDGRKSSGSTYVGSETTYEEFDGHIEEKNLKEERKKGKGKKVTRKKTKTNKKGNDKAMKVTLF